MNIDNIKNAIGNIDDDLIEAADEAPQSAGAARVTPFVKRPWLKWAAAAVAIAVIAGGVFITLNVTGATGAVAENDPNLGRQEPNNTSSGLMSSDESSDNENGEVYSETAMRAFEHFTAQLVAEYGYGVYPKDYSGFVIDNARNMLMIYLTDLNESTLQTYRDRMGENFADCVEYSKGDKSQRELWSITDKALTYLVKEAGVQIYSGRPSDKGDCIRIEIIKSDKSGAELAADLEERFGAPFDVAYYPYYSEDDVQEYAGTMDIVEGYDPHVVDGVEDGVMYVIRNYKKYKLNVITRQQAIEKYGDYAAFKFKSQSAIIHPNGAVENVQALYNDEAEVRSVNGDFVKQKNEVVEYRIDGKQMQFRYFKSNTLKRYADSSVDGVERNYVIDYYKTDDDCVISRYEDGKRILHFSTASVFNGNREISKDDAVAIARRIAANSDFGVKGIEEASVEVSDCSCYTVVMTSKFGRYAASINYYGELRRVTWAEDASLALTPVRIEAAKAKMDAAIEKWKQERPGSRYVIQKVSFARIGDDIEAVFQVTHYLDPDDEACMGYIYYCLA